MYEVTFGAQWCNSSLSPELHAPEMTLCGLCAPSFLYLHYNCCWNSCVWGVPRPAGCENWQWLLRMIWYEGAGPPEWEPLWGGSGAGWGCMLVVLILELFERDFASGWVHLPAVLVAELLRWNSRAGWDTCFFWSHFEVILAWTKSGVWPLMNAGVGCRYRECQNLHWPMPARLGWRRVK